MPEAWQVISTIVTFSAVRAAPGSQPTRRARKLALSERALLDLDRWSLGLAAGGTQQPAAADFQAVPR